ncbi:protein-tyrosine phosphatase [Proteiniborus ethanoligenes]|uniref:Protein-tyrosine phosphatase n=1 Tax=Proteiniborus ethanoligenes TaxID=415015 RepID=A0A1H3S725_9FIRM|nr:low molecular weight protein arginine phosphatase [Proteiniborus ethanoligenes]SDZ33913.1 protein-tyrosine phosphatase [Proteiniborus ethanoligenes]
MKTILFVCTGNTCRSSMAEGIFRDMIKKRNLENVIKVESAGVYAATGQPASPQAIDAMKNKAIDISSHKARQLTKEMLQNADLILTMTKSHKRSILGMDESLKQKTYTLTEYAYKDLENHADILDPYGLPVEEYEKSLIDIEKALKNVIDKLYKKIKEEL